MYVDATQIRKALIDIAKKKGRPDYGLCVVREVIWAVQNSTHHDLKQLVLDQIKSDLDKRAQQRESDQNTRLKRLREICKNEEIKDHLGEESGLGSKFIGHMARGRYEINNSLWSRLEPLLKQYDSGSNVSRN